MEIDINSDEYGKVNIDIPRANNDGDLYIIDSKKLSFEVFTIRNNESKTEGLSALEFIKRFCTSVKNFDQKSEGY